MYNLIKKKGLRKLHGKSLGKRYEANYWISNRELIQLLKKIPLKYIYYSFILYFYNLYTKYLFKKYKNWTGEMIDSVLWKK